MTTKESPLALPGTVPHSTEAPAAPLTRAWGGADLGDALTDLSFILCGARSLECRYGIPLAVGILISCAAVTAAAGPCYSLIGPHGIPLHPSMHLLLVTDALGLVQQAVLEAFHPLITKARTDGANAGTLGESQSAEIQNMADACMREGRRLKAQADEEHARLEKFFGKAAIGAHTMGVRQLRAEAEKKIGEALQLRAAAAYALRPATLVENLSPSGWLTPEKLTFDGALLNLDLHANTWSGLLGEKPLQRQKVARRLVAGLSGAPAHHAGTAHPTCDHLSSAAVMVPSLFGRIQHDDVLRTSGLTPLLLPMLVEPVKADPAAVGALEDDTNLPALLALLHKQRVYSGPRVAWKLSREAELAHLCFTRDVTRLAREIPGDAGTPLHNLPDLALKLSILLRLGMHGGMARTDAIDEAEMHTATAVALQQAGAASRAQEHSARGRRRLEQDHQVVFEMVSKLKIKGPLRQRDLFRTYHDQRTERLLPVLERALTLGMIQNHAGLLMAAGQSQHASDELPLPPEI